MTQKTEKKTTPQKTAAKKTTAKKTAVKKAPVRKTNTGKKRQKTSIVAYVDVGFGNTLYIRGEGAGLSWEKGQPLNNISAMEWAFEADNAKGTITFKFLINDEIWAEGGNREAQAGSRSISSPEFIWM